MRGPLGRRSQTQSPTLDRGMIDRRKAYHLLGESLRDIGILVTVFGPLDAFFQREPLNVGILVLVVAGGLLFMALGIIIEAEE